MALRVVVLAPAPVRVAEVAVLPQVEARLRPAAGAPGGGGPGGGGGGRGGGRGPAAPIVFHRVK